MNSTDHPALSLHLIPDPVLRRKASPVRTFDSRLVAVTEQMLTLMYHAKGIGLAGPQAGLPERIVVMDLSEDRTSPEVFINPEVVASAGEMKSEEGCLSIPGFRSTIKRAESIRVRYQDVAGNRHERDARELLSRCFQHEIDHLDGVLFTDHLRGLNKRLYLRWEKRFLEGEREGT